MIAALATLLICSSATSTYSARKVRIDGDQVLQVAAALECANASLVVEDLEFDEYGTGFDCVESSGIRMLFRVYEAPGVGHRAASFYQSLTTRDTHLVAHDNWFALGSLGAMNDLARFLGHDVLDYRVDGARGNTPEEDSVTFCLTVARDAIAGQLGGAPPEGVRNELVTVSV